MEGVGSWNEEGVGTKKAKTIIRHGLRHPVPHPHNTVCTLAYLGTCGMLLKEFDAGFAAETVNLITYIIISLWRTCLRDCERIIFESGEITLFTQFTQVLRSGRKIR